MKVIPFKFSSEALVFILASVSAHAQGTFVYDQEVSSPPHGTAIGLSFSIQSQQPVGQSFTPGLSAVDFIQLVLGDSVPGNNLGASAYVNLRSNSIAGPIMASTLPVYMPDSFGVGNGVRGITNFLFALPASVTPGNTYFFEIVVESGDAWTVDAYHYGYPGGTVYFNGFPVGGNDDLWFREGIVVPEPFSLPLILLASGILFCGRRVFR